MKAEKFYWIVLMAGGEPYLPSLSFTRRDAINSIVFGTDYTWDYCKKKGASCVKIKLTEVTK